MLFEAHDELHFRIGGDDCGKQGEVTEFDFAIDIDAHAVCCFLIEGVEYAEVDLLLRVLEERINIGEHHVGVECVGV